MLHIYTFVKFTRRFVKFEQIWQIWIKFKKTVRAAKFAFKF